MIRFGRRRTNWWVAMVLPGLLLRALIPVGFMPIFGPKFGVQLSVCDGYAPAPARMTAGMTMDMPMGMRMDEPVPHHSAPAPHTSHGLCPYGAGPTLAALPMLHDVPSHTYLSAQLLVCAPQIAHFEPAPRAQSSRGPPLKV